MPIATETVDPQRKRPAIRAAISTLAALAVMAVVVALGPLGIASAAAPPRIDLADMFLVEKDGDWFCHKSAATCTKKHGAKKAAADLLRNLRGARHPDLHLRVAKARNNCEAGQDFPQCQTAVPKRQRCRDGHPRGHPRCTLERLQHAGVKLGVIIGAEADKAQKARPVRDLAWQACQIRKADIARSGPGGKRLYDFMFLDLTRSLRKADLDKAVRRIRSGRTGTGEKGRRCPGPGPVGWDHLIVNSSQAPLSSDAWAHSKGIELLGPEADPTRIKQAANGEIDAVSGEDLAFIKEVNDLPGQGFPLLRLEVTSQTDRFARVPRAQQCSLLEKWARQQSQYGYRFMYPLYVHGVRGAKGDPPTIPYDSFREHTFGLQRALMERFPDDQSSRPLPGCGANGGNNREAPPSETGPPVPFRPAVPPGPVPPVAPLAPARPPEVHPDEPTAVMCNRATLHGWVNPHGSATTYHFEYWKTNTDASRMTDVLSAGAGRDRVEVRGLADNLQNETGYTAKLMATNAAGRAVSAIVSFRTPRRC